MDNTILKRYFGILSAKDLCDVEAVYTFTDSEVKAIEQGVTKDLAERDGLRAMCDELTAAGRAVVDRWDSPSWKEAEHTGVSIAALRKAVEKSENEY